MQKLIAKAEKHSNFELFTQKPRPGYWYEWLVRHGQEL